MIGWALRQLFVWGIGILLFFVVLGNRLITPPNNPSPAAPAAPGPAASAPTAGQPQHAMPNALVFHANKQGHVVLDGIVNGAPVRFLVDTGATFVALALRDAQAAGLGPGDIVYRGAAATANGTARVAPVRLREVRIGQFSAGEVPAVVMENLNISLLGQSFLKRLDGYEMRDGVLTLNWN